MRPPRPNTRTVKAAEGSQDFATSTGTLTIQLATTDSSTTVICSPSSVIYNGSKHSPCSATVTGAGGLNQSLTVSYTESINVGTVTASASFPGDATHHPSAGSATFTINKADAVCTISGYTGAYDGAAHGASGSCVGAAGDPTAAGSTLDLGTKFTNAPGGSADWTFTGGNNYNNAVGGGRDRHQQGGCDRHRERIQRYLRRGRTWRHWQRHGCPQRGAHRPGSGAEVHQRARRYGALDVHGRHQLQRPER